MILCTVSPVLSGLFYPISTGIWLYSLYEIIIIVCVGWEFWSYKNIRSTTFVPLYHHICNHHGFIYGFLLWWSQNLYIFTSTPSASPKPNSHSNPHSQSLIANSQGRTRITPTPLATPTTPISTPTTPISTPTLSKDDIVKMILKAWAENSNQQIRIPGVDEALHDWVLAAEASQHWFVCPAILSPRHVLEFEKWLWWWFTHTQGWVALRCHYGILCGVHTMVRADGGCECS